MPEIDIDDIRTLNTWERLFMATALTVEEKAGAAYLDNVLELLGEYCQRAGIKQPTAWDEIVDYFKTRGWIKVHAGKIKFLLPKNKLKAIKREVAREPAVKGREILEKEMVKRAVIEG